MMTIYKLYEENDDFVIRIPKSDFKKSDLNSILKDYLEFTEITKRSKASSKQANEIIKSINKSLTKNIGVKK